MADISFPVRASGDDAAAISGPSSFPQFMDLPLELRLKIYTFATPPRIVCMDQSREDYVDFVKKLRRGDIHEKLHPEKLHFANNWRQKVPSEAEQRMRAQAEEWGRTNYLEVLRVLEHEYADKPLPKIIWSELQRDQTQLAYELLQRCELYSRTPIPALLHTCRDSRQALMRIGYELAFGTRTAEPHTWFHFQRDILCLPEDISLLSTESLTLEEGSAADFAHPITSPSCHILTGSRWSFGQYRPRDLRRVRRIALEGAGLASLEIFGDGHEILQLWSEIKNVLKLFGNIEDLYLLGWTARNMRKWTQWSSRRKHLPKDPCTKMSDLQGFTPMMSIDIALQSPLFLQRNAIRTPLMQSRRLKEHKKRWGIYSPLFKFIGSRTQEATGASEEDKARTNDYELKTWSCPDPQLVHMLPSKFMRDLCLERMEIGVGVANWDPSAGTGLPQADERYCSGILNGGNPADYSEIDEEIHEDCPDDDAEMREWWDEWGRYFILPQIGRYVLEDFVCYQSGLPVCHVPWLDSRLDCWEYP